jgi:CoA:oxalate CoA-transferase
VDSEHRQVAVTMAAEAALPLKGVRVLDLTRIYSGPYCTFLMAMAGAEIIKVEAPEGEHLRTRKARAGASLPFPMLNANKRHVTINIKAPEGRDLILRLAQRSDVLVENFRPGVMEQLGLGRDVLRATNPRLIYASTNGFGSSGPYRDYAAMDLTIQALSGVMDSTGFPNNPPVKSGPAIGDFFAGIHLYGAIVSALYHRERTGEALAPEVAMMEAVYPSLCSNLGMVMGDASFARTGNRHGGLNQCPYNVYPTADGHIAIICVTERHWLALLKALGREDLDQSRFAKNSDRVKNMDYIDDELSRSTATQTRAELTDKLNAFGVPCGAVQSLAEVIRDPQLHSTGMLRELDHPESGPLVVSHSALTFRDHPRSAYRPSGALGRDNKDVFGEIGVGDEDLASLHSAGII